MMQMHRAACYCGAVLFEVCGIPAVMGYCHCTDCRTWSASPVTAFTLWPRSALTILQGSEHVGTIARTTNAHRKWCKQCGGHLMTDHPRWNLVAIYAALLPKLDFKPTLHAHYGSAVLPMRDGIPKLKNVPPELGGSGETLSE